MREPSTLAEQRFMRCRGELFRGSGIWPPWAVPCKLEPPFEPFTWDTITRWDLALHGMTHPFQGFFADRLLRLFRPITVPDFYSCYNRTDDRSIDLQIVTFAPYADEQMTYAKAEQLLLALSPAGEQIAFELYAIGESDHPEARQPRIEARFVAWERDAPLIVQQLHNHFPQSAVETHGFEDEEEFEWIDRLRSSPEKEDPLYAAPLCLQNWYCDPIRTYQRFETDPLGVAIAVMDELKRNEWALITVLFQRARYPWGDNLLAACTDTFTGKESLSEIDLRAAAEKAASPLFATSITLAANTRRAFSALTSWVHQYEGPRNGFVVRDATALRSLWADAWHVSIRDVRQALHFRETHSPGMLLTVEELTGIVHVPSPDLPAERLVRVRTKTRRPPPPVRQASLVIIGENTHRGESGTVAIPPEMRTRHCYVAGASGTGKSTLLLNMILQDLEAGHGVGLMDPHGDLLKAVLRRCPARRANDMILFDPADREHPFALNILDAADADERERITAETVMAMERYFPASWGPRLERILQYTISTALDAIPGATLADVERLLVDKTFRERAVNKLRDERLRQFWEFQYGKTIPQNASDPVLNKLSPFLSNRTVRNVICQRRAAIDFDALLNGGKVLLANLSSGLLTEKIAGMLGSFLVTKIVNAAFRRARLPEHQRRPFFLYVDEFQNLMNTSVGFERILAEARKYNLVLTVANQYVGQLSTPVRQAVFGNVGSFVIFRLGVEDASSVARELGEFTTDDILNLDRGQAIARIGSSAAAFNVRTFPEPDAPRDDPTARIMESTRTRYTRPRVDVERDLGSVGDHFAACGRPSASEPSDCSEDDFVE